SEPLRLELSIIDALPRSARPASNRVFTNPAVHERRSWPPVLEQREEAIAITRNPLLNDGSRVLDAFEFIRVVDVVNRTRAEASLYHHREGVDGTLLTVRRRKINPSLLGISEGKSFRR